MSTRPSLRQSLRQSSSTRPTRQSESTGQSTPKRQSQSMYKKKDKSECDPQRDEEKLKDVDLNKYCPQSIFNILFINETDELSNKMMAKVIEISREFDDMSYLTFITYDEVISLLKNWDKAVLPALLKPHLENLSTSLKNTMQGDTNILPSDLAKLMKIKLIEVMYKQYIKAVTKMQSRKKLVADLKALTVECSLCRDKAKAPSKTLESQSNLATKKPDEDYTNIPLESQDDIIFDDDIHHQISYYVFHGFFDLDLLQELIVSNGVEIQAILKIATPDSENSTTRSIFTDFWEQIDENFDGPKRRAFLKNTFLMTYTLSDNDVKHIFEELLCVIRNITDIKLQHLHYIRHMEIFKGKETYNYFPLECFTVYNNFFQKLPMELVNVPILLDVLLKQVCVTVDETLHLFETGSQHSYLDVNRFERNRCIDPCSVETFFKRKVKIRSKPSAVWRPTTSFMAYENDILFVILKSYKKYGSLIFDGTTKMLKNTWPLKLLNEVEVNYQEIIHKHDIDPSTKMVIRDKDIVLHFLYLFLFNLFEHRNILPKSVETELTKNLQTYNKVKFIKQCQTMVLPCNSEKQENYINQSNLYNIAPTEHFWKEELGATVLLQQLCKAQDEYLYCDERYSPETDTLLIQFSNCLDQFGINTKIYDQSLPTQICLRDFCKYITVEKTDWLEQKKFPKYVRKCVVREDCQGVKKITELEMFPEYSYLITIDSPQESKPEVTDTINENEITFEELVEEIKHYSSNCKLVKGYETQDKFLVYDFAPKYLHIKGARTTFHSHDGVKLTVDNTAMLDEYPKSSMSLECRNNSLILHTGKFYLNEDYNFHLNLADGTLVSFIIFRPKRSSKSKDSVLFEKVHMEELMWEQAGYDYEDYASTVLSVDKNYFETYIVNNLLNEEYTSCTDIAFKTSESMLQSLKIAATTNVPIYKVNNNLTHVKKLKSEFEIPLASIVKRVLHNYTAPTLDVEAFTKRYLPAKNRKHRSQLASTLDARIALPNGLYISMYPSKLKKGLLEIKQEFLCRNSSTELEEFRLFARAGYVLVKKIDGSITLFKSNGDVIDHEKLDTDSENVYKWRTKPCHCKNIEDYRKRVCKLFKAQNDDVADVAVSRRACLQTKRGYAMSAETNSMIRNSKIPYLKSSVLKFDGTRVCLEAGKVRVKKVLHVTLENNFATKESYYERGDGFRSTIDRYGKQLVEFVDGTKIRTTMVVAKELVDGYVYISLEFEFQHPDYATVAYRSDNNLEVVLNNVVFRKESEDIVLNIDQDITTTVNKKNVLFEKTCRKCKANYTCDVNIHPLVERMTSDEFIHASDSYNKHFYVDFAGKCTRNQDYIKGPINAFDCNHYDDMCYKKLFVVNRNLSGCTFWTDNMVLAKKRAMNQDEDEFNEFNDASNTKILVYKFKRNFYDQYTSRFLKESVMGTSRELVYATYCLVKRMVDVKTVESFCQDLTTYFRKGSVHIRYFKVLGKMSNENESYRENEDELLTGGKVLAVEKEECKCTKERISMREKIEKWRRECEKYRSLIRSRALPCYFNSPFCKVITKQ